jgi:hypothetical protein
MNDHDLKSERSVLRPYGPSDRLKIVRAVRRGTAVRDVRLAQAAAAYAQALQVPARRGSLTWSLAWAEVGSLAVIIIVVGVALLMRTDNLAVIVGGAAVLLLVMLPLSKKQRSRRRARASAAEDANLRLLGGTDTVL